MTHRHWLRHVCGGLIPKIGPQFLGGQRAGLIGYLHTMECWAVIKENGLDLY